MRKLYLRVPDRSAFLLVVRKLKGIEHSLKMGKTYTQKETPFYDGMPEFLQKRVDPYCLFIIQTSLDSKELSELFDQKITDKTKSIWVPKLVRRTRKVWKSMSNIEPRFPVYIISKGRPRCITSKVLTKMGVKHCIVIEPQDFDSYAKNNPKKIIKKLPFSNLNSGSIPARNWVWDDAIERGFSHHWILDDNIEDFNFLKSNTKDPVRCPSIFRYAEDFTLLFDNVGQSGFNYYSFCKANDGIPPYYLNTRIYSCILIRNDLPFRWRGKYNEDTDLSIRVLKSGLCTILFNQFLAGKITTLRMKGGNTSNVYTDDDNRLKFAQSLVEQHPDIVKLTVKFGRNHHQVNYKGFTQRLNRVNPVCFNYHGDLFQD